jgi:hypothetical protein
MQLLKNEFAGTNSHRSFSHYSLRIFAASVGWSTKMTGKNSIKKTRPTRSNPQAEML